MSLCFFGNFSIADGCQFDMSFSNESTTLDIWESLLIGSNSQVVLRSVCSSTGSIEVGRRSVVTFYTSSISTDIHFHALVREDPPLIRVPGENVFEPEAIYFDVQLVNADGQFNDTSPLMCGIFDCEYVSSRGSYATVDDEASGGFYMFRGSCSQKEDSECYLLTSSFTTFHDDELDSITIAMISTITSLVSIIIITAISLMMKLQKLRKEASSSSNVE